MNCRKRLCFLPEDFRHRKLQRRTNTLCAAMFLIAIGAIGSALAISEESLHGVEAEHATVDRQYAHAAGRIGQVHELQDREQHLARQAAAAAALIEPLPRSYVLAEITNALPPGVMLTHLTLDRNDTPASAVAAVSISGTAATDVQVAQFVNQLARSNALKNVALASTEQVAAVGKLPVIDTPTRRFSIDLSLNPAAVPPRADQAVSSSAIELAPE